MKLLSENAVSSDVIIAMGVINVMNKTSLIY